MKYYTVKQASEILGVSERAIQKKCKKEKVWRKSNRYQISEENISNWRTISEQNSLSSLSSLSGVSSKIIELIKEIDNEDYILSILEAIKDNKHLEEFTDEEYTAFEKRLIEANFLADKVSQYKTEIIRMEEYVKDYRNNIEYLKKSLDKRANETTILLETLKERNFIEAKEKGFDKD